MDVFRAVPQVKKITIEIVDMSKLDIDNLDPGNDLVEDYNLPTKRVAYIGYVKGSGTPVPVEIGVNRVNAEYDDNYPTDEQLLEMTPNQQFYRLKRANDILRRDWLCEVVRNLEPEVADSLIEARAGERHSDAEKILIALKWRDEPVPMSISQLDNGIEINEDMEPDDKGEGVTGN